MPQAESPAFIPAGAFNLEFLQPFLDTLPLGVLITDRTGRITYCNEAQCRIDDMEKSFIVGKLESEIYGPYLGPGIMNSCQEAGKPILGFVCHYRTVRGKIVNGAYWVYPLFAGGEVTGAFCLTQLLSTKAPMFSGPFTGEIPKEPGAVDVPLDIGSTAGEQAEAAPQKIVGANPEFRKMLSVAQRTASSPSPVMICAETGCGKEVFVKAVRASGNRCNKPYQAINCSAIPSTLLEGILFGAVRGSYTGAVDRPGLLEEANGGIVYLDEVDSMPLELQPKLLRVLQDMRVRRLGSSKERLIDVKVISSIGASPAEVLASGKLRPDLFYRLAVISIRIPPLRERMDDLDDLTEHFLNKYNKVLNKRIAGVDDSVASLFRLYHWPGNVRELEHVIAGAVNLAAWETTLHLHHIPEHHRIALKGLPDAQTRGHSTLLSGFFAPEFSPEEADPPQHDGGIDPLDKREADHVRKALHLTGGRLGRAAEQLGISRQLLYYKMKKHGIDKREFR